MWWRREDKHDYWCASAYLVNKTMLKPVLDGIFEDLGNGWQGVSVVAGHGGTSVPGTKVVKEPCSPAHCCSPTQGEFPPPCVRAARGYQSDHYLFGLAYGRSFMIALPLVTTAQGGNTSTLHQEHVSLHQGAFHRINKCLNDAAKGVVLVPSYVNTLCRFK